MISILLGLAPAPKPKPVLCRVHLIEDDPITVEDCRGAPSEQTIFEATAAIKRLGPGALISFKDAKDAAGFSDWTMRRVMRVLEARGVIKRDTEYRERPFLYKLTTETKA